MRFATPQEQDELLTQPIIDRFGSDHVWFPTPQEELVKMIPQEELDQIKELEKQILLSISSEK